MFTNALLPFIITVWSIIYPFDVSDTEVLVLELLEVLLLLVLFVLLLVGFAVALLLELAVEFEVVFVVFVLFVPAGGLFPSMQSPLLA